MERGCQISWGAKYTVTPVTAAQSSLPRLLVIHFSLEFVIRLRVGTNSKIYNVSVLPWLLATRNRYNELVFGSRARAFPTLNLIFLFPFLISSFPFLISHFLVPTFSSTRLSSSWIRELEITREHFNWPWKFCDRIWEKGSLRAKHSFYHFSNCHHAKAFRALGFPLALQTL